MSEAPALPKYNEDTVSPDIDGITGTGDDQGLKSSADDNLFTLPPDPLNRGVLPFLDLRDGLRAAVTCAALRRDLDPYAHSHIYPYGTIDDENRNWCGEPTEKIEEGLPNYMRTDPNEEGGYEEVEADIFLPRNHGDKIMKQHLFLRERAENSVVVFRSILKNCVSCKNLEQGIHEVFRNYVSKGNADAIVCYIKSGRATVEDIEFSIGTNATVAVELLCQNAVLMEGTTRCPNCQVGIGAFCCRQHERCVSREEEGGSSEQAKLCEDCAKSGRFCDVCREYECQECGAVENWETLEEDELPNYPQVRLSTCSQCDRRVCYSEQDGSCEVSCSICYKTICRICCKNGWTFCPECDNKHPEYDYMRPDYHETSLCTTCRGQPCHEHGEVEFIRY